MNRWVLRGLAAAGVWLVVVVALVLLGMGPRPVLLALVVAAVAVALWCVVDLLVDQEPIRWLRPAVRRPRPLDDPRANQLQRMIEAAERDPDRAAALLALLAELAGDEGVAPEHAPTLSLRQIDTLVRRLEADGSP